MSGLVPILHGQPVEFLTAALRDFVDGRRDSGIMQPVAASLEPDEIRALADHYAGLPVGGPSESAATGSEMSNARRATQKASLLPRRPR